MPFSSTNDPALLGAVAGGLLALCTDGLVVNGVTVAHEGGHTVVGLLFGQDLRHVQINVDASGETAWTKRTWWPARVIVSMAGYASPPLVGLAVLWAILRDHETAVFATGLVLLLLSVPFWKGWWTVLCGVIHVAVFTAVLVASYDVSRALAGGVAAVGLVGGLDMLARHLVQPFKRGDGSDFAKVAQALFMPMIVAKALFAAVGLATGAAAVWLLVGDRVAGTGP